MGGDGKPGSPEQKIKRFLDSCAYLLLRDNPEGTLTDYKEVMHGRNEIDVSSCPSWIADRMDAGGCTLSGGMEDEQTRFECLLDKLDGKAKKYMKRDRAVRAKVETKSQRLQRVRSQHPRAEIRICSVDTDNCFSINGRYYCIAESVYQYAPRETKEGLLYDMDRIHAVLENGIPVLFLDQDGYEMNGQDVYLLE